MKTDYDPLGVMQELLKHKAYINDIIITYSHTIY